MSNSRRYDNKEQRLVQLDRMKRRCDGNSRFCLGEARLRYELFPADGQGNRIEGADLVERQACPHHRRQFEENGQWFVFAKHGLGGGRIGRRPVGGWEPPHDS